MIKKAENGHTSSIKSMWTTCFPQEDASYTDFYFEHIYKPENTLVLIEQGILQSSCQRIPHEMMFNNRVLRTSMIVGVTTLPTYQKKGNMKKLMDVVMDQVNHQELITLVQAYDPTLYEKYGFEMMYYHKETTFTRKDIQKISNEGCSYLIHSEDMLRLYASFVKRFNGFYIRDCATFDRLKLEIERQHGKIIAYYNEKQQLEGYATCIFTNNEVIFEECIYMNSIALTKLVNLALQIKPIVKVNTSQVEDLRFLFPEVVVEDKGFTMVRINDMELFNRLYQVHATSVKEAFASSGKPLFMNEFY